MKTRDEDGRELTVLDHFKSHFPLMTDKEIREIISGSDKKLAVFIGPEGGFEQREIDLLESSGL